MTSRSLLCGFIRSSTQNLTTQLLEGDTRGRLLSHIREYFVGVLTWSFSDMVDFCIRNLDFAKFDSYAQRIRYLDYAPCAWHKHLPSSPYDLDCLAYLAQRRLGDHDHCFFPNLHRLWFTVPGYLRQCPRVFLQHSSTPLSEIKARRLQGASLH